MPQVRIAGQNFDQVILSSPTTGEPVDPSGGSSAPNSTVVTIVPILEDGVTIAEPNEARRGCLILNDASMKLYLLFSNDDTAHLSNYSVIVEAGDWLQVQPGNYTGKITGAWEGGFGRAVVTEFVVAAS